MHNSILLGVTECVLWGLGLELGHRETGFGQVGEEFQVEDPDWELRLWKLAFTTSVRMSEVRPLHQCTDPLGDRGPLLHP